MDQKEKAEWKILLKEALETKNWEEWIRHRTCGSLYGLLARTYSSHPAILQVSNITENAGEFIPYYVS
jgi:hypothetical protein